MKNTIDALRALYVKNGGALTDTYDDIAGGIPVGDYTVIPDAVEALAQLELGGGGGGGGITMLAHVTNTTSIGDYTQVTLDVATSDILSHLSNGGVLIIEYDQAYYHLEFCDLSTPWDEGVTLYRSPYILKHESTGELYTERVQSISYEGSGEEDTYGAWWYTIIERGGTGPT